MIQQPDNDEATDKAIIQNEKEKTEQPHQPISVNGTTVKPKWIFEIFHDETVYGIRQIYLNESENRSRFIGTPKGRAVRIEITDGEEIEKLTFSGLN